MGLRRRGIKNLRRVKSTTVTFSEGGKYHRDLSKNITVKVKIPERGDKKDSPAHQVQFLVISHKQ